MPSFRRMLVATARLTGTNEFLLRLDSGMRWNDVVVSHSPLVGQSRLKNERLSRLKNERLSTKAGGIDQTGKQEIAPPRCAHDSEVRDIREYGNCGEVRGQSWVRKGCSPAIM